MATKLEQIAVTLADREWHTTKELAKIQNRFGASIMILREGGRDGMQWVIESEKCGIGNWRYRLIRRTFEPYTPASPKCMDCGSTRIRKIDVRRK